MFGACVLCTALSHFTVHLCFCHVSLHICILCQFSDCVCILFFLSMLIISDNQYSLIVLKLHCFCTVFLCCVFVFPWYFAYVLRLLIHLHSIPVLFSETVFSLPSVMSHNTQYSSAVCPETVVNFVSVVCRTVYLNHIPVLFLKQSFCFCAVPQHNTYIAFLCCFLKH